MYVLGFTEVSKKCNTTALSDCLHIKGYLNLTLVEYNRDYFKRFMDYS